RDYGAGAKLPVLSAPGKGQAVGIAGACFLGYAHRSEPFVHLGNAATGSEAGRSGERNRRRDCGRGEGRRDGGRTSESQDAAAAALHRAEAIVAANGGGDWGFWGGV